MWDLLRIIYYWYYRRSCTGHWISSNYIRNDSTIWYLPSYLSWCNWKHRKVRIPSFFWWFLRRLTYIFKFSNEKVYRPYRITFPFFSFDTVTCRKVLSMLAFRFVHVMTVNKTQHTMQNRHVSLAQMIYSNLHWFIVTLYHLMWYVLLQYNMISYVMLCCVAWCLYTLLDMAMKWIVYRNIDAVKIERTCKERWSKLT